MTSTKPKLHNLFKRGISIMLALLLLLPAVTFKTSANEYPEHDYWCVCNACVKYFFFNASPVENVSSLLNVLYKDLYNGTEKFVVTSKQFIELFEGAAKESGTIPPGAIPKFSGSRLVYEYNDYNSIKIGGYIFDRYQFGTSISLGDIAMYDGISLPYNGTQSNVDLVPAKLGYYQFFVHNNDIYIEQRGTQFWCYDAGATGVRHRVANYGIAGGVSLSVQIQTPFQNATINENNYRTTVDLFNTTFTNTYPSGTSSRETWVNVSQWIRNIKNGASNPLAGTTSTAANFVATLSGGNPEQITNFSPSQTGLGVFIVPPTHFTSTGMQFWDYLATLDPNELYTQQPPEIIQKEVDLPEVIKAVLENLDDGDEVEIIIDPETGEITFNIIKGNGGTTTTPGTGECCCDHKSVLDDIKTELGNVVTELKNIVKELKSVVSNTNDMAPSGGKKWYERVADAVGDLFESGGKAVGSIAEGVGKAVGGIAEGVGSAVGSALEGAGNAVGGIFGIGPGGKTIWDFLSDLVNLPAAIAKALFGDEGLAGILKPILDFIDGFIDTVIELIVPSKGFMERTFGGVKERFDVKFPIIIQAEGFIDDLISTLSSDGAAPEINISGEMFGTEINTNAFDLNMFAPYRTQIHGIIIAFAYIPFIRKVIKRIPQLLGGVGGAN